MMRKVAFSWVFAALAIWLALVAFGVVMAAHKAGEPPFWDALSYVEKARNFWADMDAGKSIDLFALNPTIRPPGVIPVAYPFGFSYNWHRFYARMAFVPILLLAIAAVIAGWQPGKGRAYEFALLALTLVLAGMPFLYQFQPNDVLRSQNNWGLVDGLLAAITALATAAAVRSVRLRSIAWATAAAFFGAYGLLVKPSGLLLMGLVGVSWLVLTANSAGWNVKPLRDDKSFWRYVAVSFIAAAAIYLCAVTAAFTSPYYSPENIEFGIRNLKIFREEVVYTIDGALVALLLHHSCGWLVLGVIALGIVCAAFLRHHMAAVVMALVILAVGVWFWIFTTNIGDVRYFMPFVTMAFVLAIPSVLEVAERASPRVVAAVAGLAAMPTGLITLMLVLPMQPVWLQSRLGVNLFTNLYQPENVQAATLLDHLKQPGTDVIQQIYIFDTDGASRNFTAVVDYHNAIIPERVWLRTMLPVDWQRGLAFRFDEIVGSQYLAFVPLTDAPQRAAILADTTVDDYPDQVLHLKAWVSEIGANEGVEVVSETRVRLLHVTDPEKLSAALNQFASGYTWPKPFTDNNPPHWWTRSATVTPQ